MVLSLRVKSMFDFPGVSDSKASAYNAGDLGSIPGSGRSPGEGNGNPLQYSGLGNPTDRGAWGATIHGVAKSQTRLHSRHPQILRHLKCLLAPPPLGPRGSPFPRPEVQGGRKESGQTLGWADPDMDFGPGIDRGRV